MITNSFSWKVAGAAGHGILSAGMLFARTCLRGGLNVFATAEYPSLIRGGHNNLDVRVSEREASAHSKHINLLVALNKDAVDYHAGKLTPGGVVLYDSDEIKLEEMEAARNDIVFFAVPLSTIATQNGGLIMRNVVAMGATMALLDFDTALFNQVLSDTFGKKGEAIVAGNVAAAKAGYDYAKQNFTGAFGWRLARREAHGKMLLTGNEAVVAGAIKAGCKFYAAYPMTPASSLLHGMAANEKEFGIIVKHAEDEIAAINMAIGASYAGVRSMVGTSGGGFCLMTEGFGLASMVETPLVIVEAQRPGPATGMATHSGQADLRFLLHASTDEAPRIIIAPGSVEECFYYTIEAFNLAERYQMPVIILTDKYLGESYATVEEFDTSSVRIDRGKLLDEADATFRRYAVTEDGVSPRTVPGTKNGGHVASSYEHDETGFEREEEAVRVAMHNKRFRKLEAARRDVPLPELRGAADSDITIIGWGSTKGPILDAMRVLGEKGITANYLQVAFMSPFPAERIKEVMKKAKMTVCIENNKFGQLASLIRENCLADVDYKLLKYDGRPFAPEDIAAAVSDIVRKRAERIVIVNGYQEAEITEEGRINLDAIKMRTFQTKE